MGECLRIKERKKKIKQWNVRSIEDFLIDRMKKEGEFSLKQFKQKVKETPGKDKK